MQNFVRESRREYGTWTQAHVENNVKIDVRETDCEDVDWVSLTNAMGSPGYLIKCGNYEAPHYRRTVTSSLIGPGTIFLSLSQCPSGYILRSGQRSQVSYPHKHQICSNLKKW
jgi:hypothetical protein